MKKICLIALCVFFAPLVLKAQLTPTAVMQNARQKCLAINNGKYQLVRKFKFFSGNDTIVQKGEVVFEKNKTDALFGLHFWLENKTDSFARYYDGKQMYTVAFDEKKVVIDTAQKSMNSAIHGNISGDYIRFSYTDTLPMRALDNPDYHPVFDETYKNNKDTLVIYINLSDDEADNSQWVRWFFDAKTFYPVAKEVRLVDDGEVQYEHFLVTSYTFNNKDNIKWLKSQKWPKEYPTEYRKPYVKPQLLSVDSAAPDWKAETVTGDSIHFGKMSAKLYLVDFWYRACGPCVMAMPSLQAVYDKFKSRGLEVIGLNPYDYKQKDTEPFKDFLARRNVNYTLAFVPFEVAYKTYHVTAYPTFYIIGGDGKIVHTEVGYSETLQSGIEEIIDKYLNTH